MSQLQKVYNFACNVLTLFKMRAYGLDVHKGSIFVYIIAETKKFFQNKFRNSVLRKKKLLNLNSLF